jgi:tripartite-type tricarboxylate transporter receptor subunit TctC
MNFTANQLIRTYLVVASLMLVAQPADAQPPAWPSKRITFLVGAPPGGTTDIVARWLASPLSQAIGQPIVVENRPGASGNIGAELCLQAPADGHTLLIQYSGYHVGNPNLYKNLRWSPLKDFTGVAMLVRAPHVIAVPGKLAAQSLPQFIDYGRTNGKGLFYGSSGGGSIQHIAGALFGQAAQINAMHVPYKGAALALNDLVNGQIDMLITTPPSLMGHFAGRKVKLLAYTAAKRHPMLPQVPTSAEAGLPGYEVESWFAAFAPAATPKPVVDRISTEMRKIVESAAFRKRAEEQGSFASYMNPAALNEFVKAELAAWAAVMRSANVKLD